MPTIFDPLARSRLEQRVRALCVESPRQWGRMTPHQALCHMSDVFRMALGDKPVAPRRSRFRLLLRFIALDVPMNWPRGVPTLPEVEQGCGGTQPLDFELDRAELLSLIARFADSMPAHRKPTHPVFGTMTTARWGKWGYRHLDHHLRQFGV
jgi:hypothetical protein